MTISYNYFLCTSFLIFGRGSEALCDDPLLDPFADRTFNCHYCRFNCTARGLSLDSKVLHSILIPQFWGIRCSNLLRSRWNLFL